MNDQVGFVLKVVIASTAIAFLIKAVGPMLAIPETNAVALGIVLSPTIIVAGVLGWKARQQS